MHLVAYESLAFELGMMIMIDTTNFCSLLPGFFLIVTFIQGHKMKKNPEFLHYFCCLVNFSVNLNIGESTAWIFGHFETHHVKFDIITVLRRLPQMGSLADKNLKYWYMLKCLETDFWSTWVLLLRSPAISLGFTILGKKFCVCDSFLIQPLR